MRSGRFWVLVVLMGLLGAGCGTEQTTSSESAPSDPDAVSSTPDADPEAPPLTVVGPDNSGGSIEQACFAEATPPNVAVSPDRYVIRADSSGVRYCLGPQLLSGAAIEAVTEDRSIAGMAALVFREGPEGIDLFNEVALLCFETDRDVCPTGQLAVLSDGVIITAPTINAPSFDRDQIVVSGGPDASDNAQIMVDQIQRGIDEPAALGFRPVVIILGPDLSDDLDQ